MELPRPTSRQGSFPSSCDHADWHSLPFGKLLAAPKDGKPVTKWADQDDAFSGHRDALSKMPLKELSGKAKLHHFSSARPDRPATPQSVTPPIALPSNTSNSKVMFSDLDRDTFRHEGFDFIAKFFEASLLEIANRNLSGLAQRFQRVDASHFTASLYQNGAEGLQYRACLSWRGTHGL